MVHFVEFISVFDAHCADLWNKHFYRNKKPPSGVLSGRGVSRVFG